MCGDQPLPSEELGACYLICVRESTGAVVVQIIFMFRRNS